MKYDLCVVIILDFLNMPITFYKRHRLVIFIVVGLKHQTDVTHFDESWYFWFIIVLNYFKKGGGIQFDAYYVCSPITLKIYDWSMRFFKIEIEYSQIGPI